MRAALIGAVRQAELPDWQVSPCNFNSLTFEKFHALTEIKEKRQRAAKRHGNAQFKALQAGRSMSTTCCFRVALIA